MIHGPRNNVRMGGMIGVMQLEEHEYCEWCGDCIACDTDHYCDDCMCCRWDCCCELEAGDETPQFKSDNDAGDRHARATESRNLRPALSQESQRSVDYLDVGFHVVQSVVSRFTEVVHRRMKIAHLLREAVLTGQRRIDALAVTINAGVQTQHRRHHIADGGAATVGGLLGGRCLLAYSHNTIIMSCGQELGKGLGR